MSVQAKLYVRTDARRSDRRELSAASTLRTNADGPFDVQVTDVSQHGFACLTTADVRTGDTVMLGLQGVANGSAIVRWRRGAYLGCEFETPLKQSEADALFSHVVVVPGSFSRASADDRPLSLMNATGVSARQLIAAALIIGILLCLLNEWLAAPY